jgi:ankyrin repeat protein
MIKKQLFCFFTAVFALFISASLLSQEMKSVDYMKKIMSYGYGYSPDDFVYHCENSPDSIISLYLNAGLNPFSIHSSGIMTTNAAVLNKVDRFKAIGLFIDAGLDINESDAKNQTPLLISLYKPDLKMVELLIQEGADVTATSVERETPLLMACQYLMEEDKEALKIISLLIDKGAKIKSDDWKGEGALHRAVRNNLYETSKLLVEGGVPINKRSDKGITPIMAAAVASDAKMIQILLDFGADTEEISEDGYTPLDIAKENGNLEVIAVLEK